MSLISSNSFGSITYKISYILLLIFLSALESGCGSGSNATAPQYSIVVDAGSSGNRLYLYKLTGPDSDPVITSEFEVKNSIPLASFASNPESAGPVAIQPLLEQARIVLQESYNSDASQVPASVLGTAAMLNLRESEQEAIYASVDQSILFEGFMLDETRTITGQEEGLYEWTDVNYLYNNLQTGITYGTIGMGGASTQVAFDSLLSSGDNIMHVCVESYTYNVYSVSYLGLGQDLARDTMNAGNDYNACYPLGYNAESITGDFNFGTCLNNYAIVLNESQYSSLPQVQDIPGFSSTFFIGLSAVYYNLDFYGIAFNPNQILLESSINDVCYLSYDELQLLYPDAFNLYNQCANSTYADSFLYDSLNVGDAQLTATLSIDGTDTTWTLGYIYIDTTKSLKDSCI